ncbi:MAG: glutamate-1-semialdehyde 2,1-aminomutase [Candidatus Omnitrophica bacterium]|nr:glutamate-1-semialdehyde 2,1-aminomutase [Candidatus Omnitrophota bacterium]
MDTVTEQDINKRLFGEAKKFIPGGVNSPVRSFKGVGGDPVFINRASGSRLYSEDERELIDYCMSWGALILGHADPEVVSVLSRAIKDGTSFGTVTKKEIELAELIVESVPSIEKVRLTNSGTEAVMSAVRLARGYTGRDKIIKFENSYHGHADYLLVKSGSGGATFGMPDSLGVPEEFTKHTIVLPYNNLEAVKKAAGEERDNIAAIIVEPVMANYGLILPKDGFLKGLREIADRFGILLIFDEVITGFRLSNAGAQGYFGIDADLTTLGKIIGGGLPLAAFGGREDIMDLLSPQGGVYQAGTLSGNPIAVSAGIATLKRLRELNPYKSLEEKTNILAKVTGEIASRYEIDLTITNIASMFNITFKDKDIFKSFFRGLLDKGIYLSPSTFETNFVSIAHNGEDINGTIETIDNILRKIQRR